MATNIASITATTDATTAIPHASILTQLLIGTRLLRLIGTTNITSNNQVNDTASEKNNDDILFLNELWSAVGMVLNETHCYYVPSFSDFTHNVHADMRSILISPKKDHPTIKQTLKCMSERNKQALFDPSKQKEDNVPVSLVALNTKYDLSKVEYNDFISGIITLVILGFDQYIDPYEVSQEYQSNASDVLESVELNGLIGDGDRFYYIPSISHFHAHFGKPNYGRRGLPYEILRQYNEMLSNTGTKPIKKAAQEYYSNDDHRRWHFVVSHGYGDCPSGCIDRKNFLFVYDRDLKKVSLVTKTSTPGPVLTLLKDVISWLYT